MSYPMPRRQMNRQRGTASSTAAVIGAHCTISASAGTAERPAMTCSSVLAWRRTVLRPAARRMCSSSRELRSESVMATVVLAVTGLLLLTPRQPGVRDPLRRSADVAFHRLLRCPLVAGGDDVEQLLVALCVQAHATGAKRGGRGTEEVTDAAAQLAGYLDEQRVIGELPEILMKLLVQFVYEGEVLLLGCSRHAVHDRLEVG